MGKRICLGALLLLVFGCSPDLSPDIPAEADSPGVAGDSSKDMVWVEVARSEFHRQSVLPVKFHASSSDLRVITRMSRTASPVRPGLVITNFLSDTTTLPLASVQAEQRYTNQVTVDTTEISLPPGDLYLFVAEYRGLLDWGVVVQEKRPRPSRHPVPTTRRAQPTASSAGT